MGVAVLVDPAHAAELELLPGLEAETRSPPFQSPSRSWSWLLYVSLAIYSGCCCQRQRKICSPGLQAG
jgi:hypothetical protein